MRTISQVGEVELIERMRRRIGGVGMRSHVVRVGIGDDAAVLTLPGGQRLLFASDMVVEGVHFDRRHVPARWIGWKALACNVSDIAAMGGVPLAAVVSLGLPPKTPLAFVDALYDGIARCARRFGVALVGGDTVRAPTIVVDVAILGAAHPRRLALRSGARAGDALFVTGRLGGSYASGRHARFTPRLREAQALGQRVPIHAMIDLSDGLASDLWQIARASRATLRVEAQRVPISHAGRTLHHALMDGEDFELLFAVPRTAASRVPRRIGSCPVTRIGVVVARGRPAVTLQHRDGRVRPLTPAGFRHF